jgi:hypothetical protein
METFVKVKDRDSLVRDLTSGAIINTNTAEYESYLQKRNKNKEMRMQLQTNSEEIKELKSELSEIKSLLISLFYIVYKKALLLQLLRQTAIFNILKASWR